MKTLMTKTLATAALSALIATPVLAQDRNIVVQSPRAAFAVTVGEELNEALYQVHYPGEQSGVVRIHFVATPDGEARSARIVESSGSIWVDRAAMRAVDRMDALGPVPAGAEDGQSVLATIVFANDERQMLRLSRGLDDGLARLIASGAVDSTTLAVTLVPGSNG